ncbi:type I methionyl aminopeptidase [Tengunoibacter tsumagoiensis]|uniref:Methionine aminopeptidase n=1 Tax=Tengunoibacter tsumagoiensis TaxID=2014871 RepID=A0A402A0J4_9CHLR|nr:type I methionyl aminopeptidase [Tengunoibacter tsumagoiensis]GCE12670.1 methionine aminopeptidase [Tengunoibacter tsumagoiensis]
MAVLLKSRQEIAHLREAGRIVAETFEVLRPYVKPGTTTAELDRIAEDYIRGKGAIPVYKGYGAQPARRGNPAVPPFPAATCISINDEICHGIPSTKRALQNGDIVGIDIGSLYKGWVGDSCMTYAVGTIDEEGQRLMDVTAKCLELGIEQARPGKRIGDIGAAIQEYAEAHGFSTVRDLVGHGVGRSLHEDPSVPHFGRPNTGLRIQKGMVFTIEPMINTGGPETRLLPDRWTISTADGSRSAQFEHCMAITDGAAELLTVI